MKGIYGDYIGPVRGIHAPTLPEAPVRQAGFVGAETMEVESLGLSGRIRSGIPLEGRD